MERRTRSLGNSNKRAVEEFELDEILKMLKSEVVFVEGKRDVEALEKLGIKSFPIVGRVESAIKKVEGSDTMWRVSHPSLSDGDTEAPTGSSHRVSKRVVLLMDLDLKGNQLAERTAELLWSEGVKVDCESRRKLGRILRVKYFEELDRTYNEYMERRKNL